MSSIPSPVPQELCPICGNKAVPVRSFADVFGNCSADERRELVYHLAALRARRTIEALLIEPERQS